MSLVTLPDAECYDMMSLEGASYRIFLTLPDQPAPKNGFPVLYLLDGNATFPCAASSLALQTRRPETTGIGPSIVVGIGYPTECYLDAGRRTFDYTPSVVPADLPERRDGRPWPPTGGADKFLTFIERELIPAIQRRFAIDPASQALFGHSFGGLFVLHALLSRPEIFSTYVAASPSIWFAPKLLDHKLLTFSSTHHLNPMSPRKLLVTVGGNEQADDHESVGGETPSLSWKRRTRMIDNAKEFTASISAQAISKIRATLTTFDDENHASVLPSAITRGIRFALGGY